MERLCLGIPPGWLHLLPPREPEHLAKWTPCARFVARSRWTTSSPRKPPRANRSGHLQSRRPQGRRLFSAVRPAGRTCSTVKQRTERNGVSLLTARQREGLAEGQLRGREAFVGRKPRAKRWPDEQEPHRRRSQRVRRPLSLKPEVCPEAAGVDAAGISVKAGASYPGRSAGKPTGASAVETRRDVPAEVSRGHSSPSDQGRRAEPKRDGGVRRE